MNRRVGNLSPLQLSLPREIQMSKKIIFPIALLHLIISLVGAGLFLIVVQQVSAQDWLVTDGTYYYASQYVTSDGGTWLGGCPVTTGGGSSGGGHISIYNPEKIGLVDNDGIKFTFDQDGYSTYLHIFDFGAVFNGTNMQVRVHGNNPTAFVVDQTFFRNAQLWWSVDGINFCRFYSSGFFTTTGYDFLTDWISVGTTQIRYIGIRQETPWYHLNQPFTPKDGYIDSISLAGGTPVIGLTMLPDQTHSPNECPFCGNEEKVNFIGGPINTSTGNYNYETTDLSIPSVGQPLNFERSYNSATITGTAVYSRPLGYGWTHNYDINLTFPGAPGGEPETVILKAPHGSRLRFTEVSTGTYEPYPGVWANMVRQGTTPPYTYVITAANQTAYTFVGSPAYTTASTSLITKTLPISGAAGDSFGWSVAVSGDTAIVGAPYNDEEGYEAGAAYVYVRTPTGYSLQQKLVANDSIYMDYFGISVALDGNTAVVGTRNEDEGTATGSAYVFTRSGSTWTQQAKLVATNREAFDYFGDSVAISGDTVIVGAHNLGGTGAAYIFKRNGTQWGQNCTGTPLTCQENQKLLSGSGGNAFGYSVAISGTTAVIGANEDDAQAADAGSAHIFAYNGITWTQQAKLVASDGAVDDYFGRSVALGNNRVIIGANEDDNSAATNAGAAYIFDYNGSQWGQNCTGTPSVCQQTVKLTATDGITNANFGRSVTLRGDTTLVGAASSAYIYTYNGTIWTPQPKLTPNDGDSSFGWSIGFDGQTITVGSHSLNTGSAYLFGPQPEYTRLTSIRDPQGNRTVFTYTNGITLTAVGDERSGRSLNFGYDPQGRLNTLSDHTSRTVTYGYNGNNDLVSVRDSRGFTWTYTYSGTTHLLRQVIDPENKVLEDTTYTLVNGEYKATLQTDGAGRTMAQIEYLSDTQRRVTEAGKVITDTYGSRNLLVRQTDALGRDQNYVLDSSFNRTGVTDIRDQPTAYGRTSMGLTTAITNALGQATTLQYDTGTNNLSAVIEDDGTLTDYTYDSGNNLRQITTVSGTTRLDYNNFGQVISTTDRLTHLTRFGYDLIGNLTVITDAKLQTTRFTYDAQGRVETVTNARGMVTRYQYDAGDNIRFVTEHYQTTFCPPHECNLTVEFQYDNAGRLVWTIDPAGRRTKREYDNGGLLVKIITNYQDGTYHHSAPDEDVTIRYGYDSAGRLQSLFETLAAGPQGERETRILYDELSRVDQVIFNYGGGSAQLTTRYEYEDNSTYPFQVVTVTDPTGLKTRTEYDALGRLAKRIDNYQTTSCPATECNLATRYEYDDVGNLKRLYDPANLRTEYQYDPLHRLIGVTENYTGTGAYSGIVDENVKTSYQYDNEGNLLQATNLPTGRYTSFTYDELNRLDLLNNGLVPMTTDYDYDPVGNLSKIIKPDSKVINYQYDLINRLTHIDYPNPDADVTLGYDKLGRRTDMSDGVGTSVYIYDDLDRLIGFTQPAVGGSSSAVGFGYDARGNRTRLTYPDGKTIVYGYDNADRITSVSPDWDSGSYSYQYANHRLITMTNPAGVVTTYNYDTANRLNSITHRQGSQTLGNYNYALDSTGNVRTVTETQVSVLPAGTYQESGGQVVMESENGQRMTGLTHQWLTATAQSGYTGTAYLQTSLDVDQLYQTSQITSSPRAEYAIQLTTPGTYTVWLRGYPANAAGDSLYAGTKNQMVGVTGFAPGQWTWAKLNLSNGAAATLPLTKTGLITVGLWMREDGLQIDRLLLTTSTTFIPTGFGPAESSRIAAQTTLSTTITRTLVYTYDDLYRLTNANYSTGELFAYTYDPAGNRKTQTTLAGTNVYTYDAANRLTQVDGQTYTWDNNGNLLNDGSRTFTYDSADRLTAVTQGATTTQFTYNGDGDRLAQIIAGVTTNYALDPTGLAQVLIETTSGQSTHYLPGLAQYGGNAWSYYLPDRLGSVRQIVDPSSAVTLARIYDPFGNGLEQVGGGQSAFGYTGEQMDPTGLVFLRARYYNPTIGRFLTADTMVPDPLRSGGWNRYAYVNNNSVNYIDPSGQRPPCGGLGSSNECDESRYYAGFTVGRPYAPPGYHDAIREAMDPRHFLDPIFNHIVGGLVTVPIGDLAGHLVGLHPPVIQGLNPRTSAYWDAFGDPGPTGLNWNGIRYAH